MDRLACVDVPALPLQLLLVRHPDWHAAPVAVVAEDRPQALIGWVNAAARAQGVRPGQRYAEALSRTPDLRARPVPPAAVSAAVATCAAWLRRHAPSVEPAPDQPGVFWLDATGLVPLYPSLRAWAEAALTDLAGLGFVATMVVGFSRFAVYALARLVSEQGPATHPEPAGVAHRVQILPTAAAETAAVAGVPLARLDVPPRLLERLEKLDVRTVGQFLALPPAAVLRRFGPDAHDLHQLAAGSRWAPLRPERPPTPAGGRLLVEPPESDVHALLFRVKRLLDAGLRTLAARAEAAAGLSLRCTLDHAPPLELTLRAATPTRDAAVLLDLLRLRLEQVALPAAVIELHLTLEAASAPGESLALFPLPPSRDRAAAERALARLRASLGDAAVGRFVLREGHLPEAQFSFEPLGRLPPSPLAPELAPAPCLVRRLAERPRPIPPPAAPFARGGPHLISGGWWQQETRRAYGFSEAADGTLCWVFYDATRRRWFVQGWVT